MDILIKGIVGSQAYGLATPDSDIDYMGVYKETTDYFSGLRLIQDKELTIHTTSDSHDLTAHEVSKFMRLALKSNPSILELLWLPEHCYVEVSDAGHMLIDSRHWFASAELVKNAYLGYATQQFKLFERDGNFGSDMKKRTEKHARHLYRLLLQGLELYLSGQLVVELDSRHATMVREFGTRVANGDIALAHEAIASFESVFNTRVPKVRSTPNTEAAKSLLLDIRRM